MICCICGDTILPDEALALSLDVRNAFKPNRNAPRQTLFAHDYCFSRVLHQSVPFDAEVLAE